MANREIERALASVVEGLAGPSEVRDGQLEMANAVAVALREGRHLVVRAGTGTGKSLAYLVPAVLSAKRVVVATATKALQDQLAAKDIPSMVGRVGRPFSATVLKGRANYLCVERLGEARTAGVQEEFGSAPSSESSTTGRLTEQAKTVISWAETTTTGDRAELGEEIDQRIWNSFSVSAEECPGAFRCPSASRCFAEAARAAAAEADIVVVNQHLLGADVASDGAVLPEHDALIVDEAHELEAVMSASLGVSLGAGRIRALGLAARATSRGQRSGALESASTDILEASEQFETALRSLEPVRISGGLPEDLARTVELVATRIGRLETLLSAETDGELSQPVARALLAAGRLRTTFVGLGSLGSDDVVWVDHGARATLEIAPLDVADRLRTALFERYPVVLTSATVPRGLPRDLGAPHDRTEVLDVGSPFAYEDQSLLYCAAHLPDRRNPSALDAVCDELEALINAAGGRTLALFTSHAAMTTAAQTLRGRIDHPLLVQGERSKRALLEEFSLDATTCLFATMGFWQGIDVPGPSLSLVVIDRLPFARPDDPLLSARRERAGPEAFRSIDLPRAATLLAQGAGRLLRSTEDHGVVAVLDARLATASYRWDLIRALPPMRRSKDREVVLAYLRELDASARAGDVA